MKSYLFAYFDVVANFESSIRTDMTFESFCKPNMITYMFLKARDSIISQNKPIILFQLTELMKSDECMMKMAKICSHQSFSERNRLLRGML